MPTYSPFGLLVQTGPQQTVAGGSIHPTQQPRRPFLEALWRIVRAQSPDLMRPAK